MRTALGAHTRASSPTGRSAWWLALAMAQWSTAAPIEVVDVGRLPQPLRDAVGHSCAFVKSGARRIYISSSCPAYQRAESSVLDAMKLAALLRHELAHLEGADEARARRIAAQTFRALLARAPHECQTPGMVYAVALEQLAIPRAVITEGARRPATSGRAVD